MRRFNRPLSLLLVVLFIAPVATFGQHHNDFYIKNGDRIVFYGDSITDQRLYTTFVESYIVTRFPQLNVSFVHSGWGGDRVTGGGGGKIDQRLERDVIAYKPTVVTIMLGMNDAGYRAFDQTIFDTYRNGYEEIIKKLKGALPGLRITLIQPSPFDDVTRPPTFEGGYNAVLLRYGGFVRELAERERLHVADLNTSVVAALQKANASDPNLAQKIIQDRVHPGAGGHLLMAAALLKSWNAPSTVTRVEIDAEKGKVTSAQNTKTGELQKSGTGALSWTQADMALPMPFDMSDAPLALAVRSSDVVDSLNRQPLIIKNLSAARYNLKIDGETIGAFTKEDLEKGINLAAHQTPMLKQAMDVHALTLKHNTVHFARWRQVQVPLQDSSAKSIQSAMKALDDLEADLVAQQRAMAQPKTRKYDLTPE